MKLLLFVVLLLPNIVFGQSLYGSSVYSGGTGDHTDVLTPQLKLVATSGYIRVPHLSASSTVSVAYNFQTGKNVYWGEPSDIGSYNFRGRHVSVSEGQLLVGVGSFASTANVKLELRSPNKQFRITDTDDNKFWQMSASSASLAFRFQEDQPDDKLAMIMTSSGNVGIGTTAPTHRLQLNDGTLQIVNPGVSTSYSLIFRDEESSNSSYFFHRKTANYQILGSNKNGTGTLRKLGFAIGGGDDEADVKMTLDQNGNLLINKTTQVNTAYKLDVNGSIRSNEVVVNTTGADFVFADNYRLRPLEEVEEFITANNHLPDVASASEMEQNGLELGRMDIKLLQKVEELTLYLIELKKEVHELKKENAKLTRTIDELDRRK